MLDVYAPRKGHLGTDATFWVIKQQGLQLLLQLLQPTTISVCSVLWSGTDTLLMGSK
jgi:hypothetical protein